ncbi:hypothetical protein ACFFWD_05405 [Bradyrhizobium erythrophlei]|uniref:hypothetical protein n=1 Tax=Bradyrhizobium erythrophlei TaxID=1437360 RepID=UPI0035E5D9CF
MTDQMTVTCEERPAAENTGAKRGNAAAVGVARFLSLAAAPIFAIMALVSAFGGPVDMVCASMHDASPLGGMVAMYALMSAFHLAPWLRLVR